MCQKHYELKWKKLDLSIEKKITLFVARFNSREWGYHNRKPDIRAVQIKISTPG